MTSITKLLLGTLIGGAAWQLYKRSRTMDLRPGDDTGLGDELGEFGADPADITIVEIVEIATTSGIAEVDPESLSQVSGEGIDLDRDLAAHSELQELRERMPGKTPG